MISLFAELAKDEKDLTVNLKDEHNKSLKVSVLTTVHFGASCCSSHLCIFI